MALEPNEAYELGKTEKMIALLQCAMEHIRMNAEFSDDPDDRIVSIKLSGFGVLEVAFWGGKQYRVDLSGRKPGVFPCPDCHGTGWRKNSTKYSFGFMPHECTRCNGMGRIST